MKNNKNNNINNNNDNNTAEQFLEYALAAKPIFSLAAPTLIDCVTGRAGVVHTWDVTEVGQPLPAFAG